MESSENIAMLCFRGVIICWSLAAILLAIVTIRLIRRDTKCPHCKTKIKLDSLFCPNPECLADLRGGGKN